jgi:hypothetical protein
MLKGVLEVIMIQGWELLLSKLEKNVVIHSGPISVLCHTLVWSDTFYCKLQGHQNTIRERE